MNQKIMAINRLPESIRRECEALHIIKDHMIKLAESGIDDEETLLKMIAAIENRNIPH